MRGPSAERRLAVGVALEGFETARRRTGQARRLGRLSADDQKVKPAAALFIGRHAVAALEDRLLDSAVRRDLDRVPDREAVVGNEVVALVDAAVDRQPHGPGLGRGAQPLRFGFDVGQQAQLKLEAMTARDRVKAALAGGVADRPPAGAWGHTYREEWSPEALARITVERVRKFGWDFVKFQPRASCFAEAFGSVYKPAGHALRAPVLVSPAVPDLDSWKQVELVNRKALDDQVESIGIVARELGSDVPVIQTVFSPITVGGYLVGKSQSRIVRELRKHPDPGAPRAREGRGRARGFQRRIRPGRRRGGLLRHLRLRGPRRDARGGVSRAGAAARPPRPVEASEGGVVQRPPPVRLEPELRAVPRVPGAGRQLVHPQPGQPVARRGP